MSLWIDRRTVFHASASHFLVMVAQIQQTDPRANYLAHRAQIDAALQRVLDSGWYILGKEVDAFEREFADFLGAAYAVGVASGTDALKLALLACGVGVGDLVFTVSHTAVATVAAIELTGATPVLVDIDPLSYSMDAECLRAVLHNHPPGRPRAVVPVHLYGHPVDMAAICQIAEEHGLFVVEDCSQAHGAIVDGRNVGTWGLLAAFSFYPTKNLGAFGDGGAVVSGNYELAETVRGLREYGWRERYVSETPGGNSRLDSLQAAVLRAKLSYLDSDNARRRSHARRYKKLLVDSKIGLPVGYSDVYHVYHQFVIRTKQRNRLQEHLRDCGVSSAIHYPVPVHLQPAYAGRVLTAGKLVHTDAAVEEILSLPMYPELMPDQVNTVAQHILEWSGLNH